MLTVIERGIVGKANEPIRMCPEGMGFMGEIVRLVKSGLYMCRNSGYKDPIYTEMKCKQAC